MPIRAPLCVALPAFMLSLPAQAQTSVAEPTWNLRARHEQVDDDTFARTAIADTLRLRAGLRFRFSDRWSAFVEGEGVVNADDRYNSGANGRTRYPTVIDPEGAELNQAWIAWHGKRTSGMLGRQRIQFDNRRWIGNVGWRQNEQTFDALALQWDVVEPVTLRYAWLARAHRVSGDDARDRLARERSLDTHLLNLGVARAGQHWIAYAYLHRDRDLASASTATYGLRWTGNRVREGQGWSWTLEGSRQHDYQNNPLRFSHDYWLIEPAYTWRGTTLKAGWEQLDGDGRTALQTPLATLHAFDGWADKFLVTPVDGLENRYLSLSGKLGGIGGGRFTWTIAYHDFRAARDSASAGRYGSEWDASLEMPITEGLQALVKVADYRSDGFARDTTKLWLQMEWRGAK